MPISQQPTLTTTLSTFTLTLTSSGGGTVSTFNIASYNVTAQGTSYAVLTIQLVDSNGNPANTTVDQWFAIEIGTGFVTPSAYLKIPAGSSTVVAAYYNLVSGQYIVNVQPASGPLAGVASQQVSVYLQGVPTDPNAIVCNLTRPLLRDSVRRRLGIQPPIDAGTGINGQEPADVKWPSNQVINQAIADTLREISNKLGDNISTGVTISVPATTNDGMQYISLRGVDGCSTQNAVDFVKRAVWTSGAAGTPQYRLYPTSVYELDRMQVTMDIMPPADPTQYVVEGYEIGLWPGALYGGTLTLYVGTGFFGFTDDTSPLTNLPQDWQNVLEDGAAAKAALMSPMLPGAQQLYQQYTAMYLKGTTDILKGQNELSQAYQYSIGFNSYRWASRRGQPVRRDAP